MQKVNTESFFITLTSICQSTLRHILEDHSLEIKRCLQSLICTIFQLKVRIFTVNMNYVFLKETFVDFLEKEIVAFRQTILYF